jgi:hypothetical protein
MRHFFLAASLLTLFLFITLAPPARAQAAKPADSTPQQAAQLYPLLPV